MVTKPVQHSTHEGSVDDAYLANYRREIVTYEITIYYTMGILLC